MSNYNPNDDFFSSEYDKLANKGQQQTQQPKASHVDVDGWYGYNSNQPAQPTKAPRRNLVIVVTSVLMVLAFVAGFLFSTVLKPVSTEELLNEVINTIENDLLWGEDITDEQRVAMIEQSGTAMLQTLDRYSRLMSPQTAYALFNPIPTNISTSQGYFGFAYQYSTFGLYVSQVTADSNAYGKVQEGDLVVHFSNCYDANGNFVEEFSVSDYDQAVVVDKMGKLNRCTLSVLRGGELVKVDLVRSKIGNGNDEFTMIEYYFGAGNTNMSTTPQNGAAISTVEGRQLDKLPNHVGYIRLAEFEHYRVGATEVTAEQEFKKALDKFKQSGKTKLVVDLKGNPGGWVSSACNIIGLLAQDDTTPGKLLGCTMQDKNKNTSSYFAENDYKMYSYYFGQQDGNTKDIVVWTDGNSASASELTTGALLDYGTAIQMGTTSFGKGIAQTAQALNYSGPIVQNNGVASTYNWYVYYTTAYYFSPKGTNIHGVGYTPNAPYNNLATYSQLVDAVSSYWG